MGINIEEKMMLSPPTLERHLPIAERRHSKIADTLLFICTTAHRPMYPGCVVFGRTSRDNGGGRIAGKTQRNQLELL